MPVPKLMTIECAVCRRHTKHEVLKKIDMYDSNEGTGIDYWDSFRIVRCRGCETCSFVHLSQDSENVGPGDRPNVTQHVYPNPKTRTPIKGHYYFPNKVRRLYRETLAALSNEAPTLAAAGLRGIVEATCLDQGIKKGDLKDKINALGLPAKQAELLHLQRYLGNLAVHELQKPEEEEVLAGLEIVEILLATLYILPETADKMKRSRAEAAQKQKAQSQSGPAKP